MTLKDIALGLQVRLFSQSYNNMTASLLSPLFLSSGSLNGTKLSSVCFTLYLSSNPLPIPSLDTPLHLPQPQLLLPPLNLLLPPISPPPPLFLLVIYLLRTYLGYRTTERPDL